MQRMFLEIDADHIARNVRRAIDAALANDCIQDLIAKRALTWDEEKVRRNPPVWLQMELGEVCVGLGEFGAGLRYAARRQLGRLRAIRLMAPDDWIYPFFYTLRLYKHHPRRVRQECRMALKAKLGRRDRRVVKLAMQKTQARFIESVREERGLSSRIRKRTGLTVKEFWRKVRNGPIRKKRAAKK